MLDARQVKILRKIKRSKYLNTHNLPKEINDDLGYLLGNGFVIRSEQYDDVTERFTGILSYEITPLGRAALSKYYRENRHWYIPVIISLIALIKSFQPEIIELLAILLK